MNNMVNLLNGCILYTIVFLSLNYHTSAALPEVPEDAGAAKIWQGKRETTIQDYKNKQKSEMMAGLGAMLLQLKTLNYRNCAERDHITNEIQQILLAIPGHAEYYRDKINKTRELMETALNTGDESNYIEYRNQLTHAVMYGFLTMQQLPSSETVQVLGEFLFDERGYVKVLPDSGELGRDEYVKHSPVFDWAARSLDGLPIMNKPRSKTSPSYLDPKDVSDWRTWYVQIKSGKRTFRFEDDPTEYDLNGPAPKEKLERIASDQRRNQERARRHHAADAPEGGISESVAAIVAQPGTLGIILAASLLCVATFWYFLRNRKRAAG